MPWFAALLGGGGAAAGAGAAGAGAAGAGAAGAAGAGTAAGLGGAAGSSLAIPAASGGAAMPALSGFGGFGPAATFADKVGYSAASQGVGVGLPQYLNQLRTGEGMQGVANAAGIMQALQPKGDAPQAAPAMANTSSVQLSRQGQGQGDEQIIQLLIKLLAQGRAQ